MKLVIVPVPTRDQDGLNVMKKIACLSDGSFEIPASWLLIVCVRVCVFSWVE